MKRFAAILFVFLLGLSMVACENVPPENTTNGADVSETKGTTNETTNFAETGTVDVQTLRTEGWRYINLDTVVTLLECSVGEGGYYYLISGHLYFYDPAANISVVLCQKAGCLHENEKIYKQRKTCEAYIGGWHIFVYDSGYIYYDKDDDGDQLFRRNADGTGEMHIAMLGENYTDSEHSVQLGEYLFSDGFLYYTISVDTVERNPDGVLELKNAFCALLRLDLTTGKEEEITRIENGGIGLVAAKKDAVLYTAMDHKYYEVPNGPDRLEAMFNTPLYTYLWTMGSNTSQELLCKPYREFLGTYDFDYGKVISLNYDTDEFYSYDLITGESQPQNMPTSMVLQNDYFYVDGVVYDAATNTEYPNEFLDLSNTEYSEVRITFFARGNDGLLMQRLYFGPDADGSAIGKLVVYSYVPYEALADGLQIQDAVDFLTEKHGD